MAGQEYRPIADLRRTGSNPIFIAGSFSLIVQDNGLTSINQKEKVILFPCSLRDIMAQPLTWLMLTTKAMGKCLMNGY